MTHEQINKKINAEFDTIIREENKENTLSIILKRKSDSKIFKLYAKKNVSPGYSLYIYNNTNNKFEHIYSSIDYTASLENAYEKMLSMIEHF